jgi:hypothetical protein
MWWKFANKKDNCDGFRVYGCDMATTLIHKDDMGFYTIVRKY